MMRDLKNLRVQISKDEKLRFVYHVLNNSVLELMVKTVPCTLNEFKLLVTARTSINMLNDLSTVFRTT